MRVVVTRPSRSGEKTATMLEAMGHTPVLLPLSAPQHDPTAAFAGLSSHPAAIAVTSAEAIHVLTLLGDALAPHLQTPLFAVGEATAMAARETGFTDIRVAEGDGEALASLITASHPIFADDNRPLLYLAGSPRTQSLEVGLSENGIPFRTLECYRMIPVTWSQQELDALLLKDPVDAILFYSSEAARLFFKAISPRNDRQFLQNTHFICISEKVSALVPGPLRANTHVGAKPNETAMLSLLETLAGT